MTKPNDGGSAFPYEDETVDGKPGMTLRDYFAAKAMEGLLANSNTRAPDGTTGQQFGVIIAPMAYGIADAMISERNKK